MMTRATAKGEGREEGGKLIAFFAENTEGEVWRGLWSGGAGQRTLSIKIVYQKFRYRKRKYMF